MCPVLFARWQVFMLCGGALMIPVRSTTHRCRLRLCCRLLAAVQVTGIRNRVSSAPACCAAHRCHLRLCCRLLGRHAGVGTTDVRRRLAGGWPDSTRGAQGRLCGVSAEGKATQAAAQAAACLVKHDEQRYACGQVAARQQVWCSRPFVWRQR